MSLPEGWEWLDDVPDEWEAPEELRRPTRFPHANLAIRMLSCEYLSHENRVLLGRFISEYSLFQMWYLDERKESGGDPKEAALLAQVPMNQTRLVYEAWKQLENAEGAQLKDAAQAALADALWEAVAGLAHAREATPPS
ncbi:hypothetical protein [Allorhizocola rhizosphaerae]|uniref:hypothetical protein n=1 Tax=Allorhizocola rhizosphaerae TaxID=1872709 RepID=UPI0013C3122F|nr:hypothetical protein [Allorhizocola rhizosphaerae]